MMTNMMKRKATTRHARTAFLTGIATLSCTMTLHAQAPQPAVPAAPQSQEVGEVQRLQARAQEIESELQLIAAEAERNNPELIDERSAFIGMFESKLEEQGYPDQEEQQKLQEMQMRLQNPQALDDEERQKLTAEFQQAIAKMRQAEAQVREDPEVQSEQKKLLEARNKAMVEINPNVSALEREREEVFAQLNAITRPQQEGSQP